MKYFYIYSHSYKNIFKKVLDISSYIWYIITIKAIALSGKEENHVYLYFYYCFYHLL
nr:MAG TPA: hypothetical protein [Caudoviricetes sp.]